MVFWLAILIGALGVRFCIRLGFYETWGLLFNVIVSVYVAIFLAPRVAEFASSSGQTSAYSTGFALIALAGGCFALLYGLSYVFITGQFKVSFPETFDLLLAGAMGFVIGFLVMSFAALVVTATPLAQHRLLNGLGFNPKAQQASTACLARSCNAIHWVVGKDHEGNPALTAINRLISVPAPKNIGTKDANEPVRRQMPEVVE